MLRILWLICDIIGLIFIVANGQILKNILTIWSHRPSQSFSIEPVSLEEKERERHDDDDDGGDDGDWRYQDLSPSLVPAKTESRALRFFVVEEQELEQDDGIATAPTKEIQSSRVGS